MTAFALPDNHIFNGGGTHFSGRMPLVCKGKMGVTTQVATGKGAPLARVQYERQKGLGRKG